LGDLSCNKPTMVILWIYSGKISTRWWGIFFFWLDISWIYSG
jgi:hypothetical protein